MSFLVDYKTSERYREVHSRNGQVFLLPSSGKMADIIAGVIIQCKNCRKQVIVTKGSLCDLWKLCVECMRKKLEAKR